MGRCGKLTLEAKHRVFLSSPSYPHLFSCTYNSSPSNVGCLVNKRTDGWQIYLKTFTQSLLIIIYELFSFKEFILNQGALATTTGTETRTSKKQ